MTGKKIIPVGTKSECMPWNPVGVSGSTGRPVRVDCGESCKVVMFQVKSGVEVRGQQNKNAREEVSEEWELFEKNIQGQHHVSEHTKGYAEIPEGL